MRNTKIRAAILLVMMHVGMPIRSGISDVYTTCQQGVSGGTYFYYGYNYAHHGLSNTLQKVIIVKIGVDASKKMALNMLKTGVLCHNWYVGTSTSISDLMEDASSLADKEKNKSILDVAKIASNGYAQYLCFEEESTFGVLCLKSLVRSIGWLAAAGLCGYVLYQGYVII